MGHSSDYAAMSLAEKMLRRHEGEKAFPYRCTEGLITIGVGRCIERVGLRKDEIELMLANDIQAAVEDLQTFTWWKNLSSNRKAALIDMRFNLGGAGIRGFKKCIAAIEDGDYSEAATQMLESKWALQVGHRAKELAQLMQVG